MRWSALFALIWLVPLGAGIAFCQAEVRQAAEQELSPKATTVDGQPALVLDYGDGMGFLIVGTTLADLLTGAREPTLKFAVYHWIPSSGLHCPGFLWVSKSHVSYVPVSSGVPKDERRCVQDGPDGLGQFDIARNEISFLGFRDGSIELRAGAKIFTNAFFVYGIGATYYKKWPLGVDSREKALANEIAGGWLRLAYADFDNAEQKFLAASEPDMAARSIGEAAEEAGDLRKAFETYVNALVKLPAGAGAEREDSLREPIIRVALKLNPRPSIPEEASRHYAYALAAIQDGNISADLSKLNDAIDELEAALRIAPWWPDAYFNLGLVLEMRERYTDAARNLKLYLLAAPNSPDAAAVQQKIYHLEYKAGAR
jgi:hypothetical protein